MNFKKIQNKFWARKASGEEGFTLVELIVVIAILGILAGVGTVAYSGYVKKANMQADMTLVSDVTNALLLQYYNSGSNSGGFVTLAREDVTVPEEERVDEFGRTAMEAAFGEGWLNNLVLKHNWNANLSGAAVTTIPANKMLETTSVLTDVAAAVVGGQTNNSNATSIICSLLNGDETMEAELRKYEDDPAYATIATNLMVKYISDEMGNMTGDSELSPVGTIVTFYATLYSMANSDNPYASTAQLKVEAFDAAMEALAESEVENPTATSVSNGLMEAMGEIMSDQTLTDGEGNAVSFGDVLGEYVAENQDVAEGMVDAMGFVNTIAQGYTDSGTLANDKLYASEAVQNLLADYQNANKYGVVVRIDSQGVVTVLPLDANPAD